MKRRDFVKTVAPLAAAPVVLNGFSVRALADNALTRALAGTADTNDHVLVVIQMSGGNDGLNTVLPLDQYSNLSKARENILIAENKALRLTGQTATALHPAMTGMRALYDDGMLNIVQNVGYPQQNFSHFRSTDIWLTASDSNEVLESGWLGRFLDKEYPGYPDNYPSTDNPDPIALQIGSVISPALMGPHVSMGFAVSSTTQFYQLITGVTDPVPNTPEGHELGFIRTTALQTNAYSDVLKKAAGAAANKSALYPAAGTNLLADQLKIVSQLIAGGLRTKIYMVDITGFDTHSNQVEATGGTETGRHASLLKMLSEAITAFQDDLKLLKTEDRVMGMTFSEFGRRVKSNASMGTDHGAAAPMFVFGKNAIGGITGKNPTIGSNVTVNDNVEMQFDFRAIYSTLLKEWFGVSADVVRSVLGDNYQSLTIVDGNSAVEKTLSAGPEIIGTPYPNPCGDVVNVELRLQEPCRVSARLMNMRGQTLRLFFDRRLPYGRQTLTLDMAAISGGQYLLRLDMEQGGSAVRPVVKAY